MVKAAMEAPITNKCNPLYQKEIKSRRIYMKRKECIKRKTKELSILCGINACTVILGPNGEVDSWPENPRDVKLIIDRCKEHGNDLPGKKLLKPSEFSGEKINSNKFLWDWKDDWVRGLSQEVLKSFLADLVYKLKAVESRIEVLNMMNSEQSNPKQGEPIIPSNDYAQLGACGHSYFPVSPQPLNCYRFSDQILENCNGYTQQFLPTAESYLQPLAQFDEVPIGSVNVNPPLNCYRFSDQIGENCYGYIGQFLPTNESYLRPSAQFYEGSIGSVNVNPPLNCYRFSDQIGENFYGYTRQFLPTNESYLQPLAQFDEGSVNVNPVQSVEPRFGEGSLNGYGYLDEVGESNSNYFQQFFTQDLRFIFNSSEGDQFQF